MQVALSDLHKLELEIEVKTLLLYFISTPVSLFAYIITLLFFCYLVINNIFLYCTLAVFHLSVPNNVFSILTF